MEIHNHTRTALEKSQTQCHNQQEKIKTLGGKIEDLNLDFYKKQISELQYKISNITAELKAETLEKQALAHHQEQMKDNMKQAVQKQNILEQEIAHLKLTTERVCFTKNSAFLGGSTNFYGHTFIRVGAASVKE